MRTLSPPAGFLVFAQEREKGGMAVFGDLGGRDAPLAEHLLWDVQKGHWEPLCLCSCVAVSLCHRGELVSR